MDDLAHDFRSTESAMEDGMSVMDDLRSAMADTTLGLRSTKSAKADLMFAMVDMESAMDDLVLPSARSLLHFHQGHFEKLHPLLSVHGELTDFVPLALRCQAHGVTHAAALGRGEAPHDAVLADVHRGVDVAGGAPGCEAILLLLRVPRNDSERVVDDVAGRTVFELALAEALDQQDLPADAWRDFFVLQDIRARSGAALEPPLAFPFTGEPVELLHFIARVCCDSDKSDEESAQNLFHARQCASPRVNVRVMNVRKLR